MMCALDLVLLSPILTSACFRKKKPHRKQNKEEQHNKQEEGSKRHTGPSSSSSSSSQAHAHEAPAQAGEGKEQSESEEFLAPAEFSQLAQQKEAELDALTEMVRALSR